MSYISLKDFSFKYSLSNDFALNNINMDIFQGDKILLIGKKGASKSTLLKLLKPSIMPNGHYTNNIQFNIQDNDISYVPQNISATFLSTKVISNIVFSVENQGLDKLEIERRLCEICLHLSISHILDKHIDELSGGERQLVAIAGAIITYPKILLLDEPLAELSVYARKKIISALDQLHKETNTTIILCEHQSDDCISFADKIGLLEKGSLLHYGNKSVILRCIYNDVNNNLFVPDITKLSLHLDDTVMFTPSEFRSHYTIKNDYILPISKKQFDKTAISIKNLIYFHNKKEKVIFDELSLNIKESEKLAIVGDNGAGKTTLLKLIVKLLKPYSGSIKISSKNISYLPQDVYSFFTKETVFLELKKLCKDPYNNEIIEMFNIYDIFNKSPYDLSSGEALTVCICSVLLADCDILILDEPTKNLDVFSKEIFGQFLLKSDLTVIMSSHDLDFCAKYMNNCAFLFNKKISYIKNAKEFMLDNTLFTTSIKKATKNTTTYDEALNLWD